MQDLKKGEGSLTNRSESRLSLLVYQGNAQGWGEAVSWFCVRCCATGHNDVLGVQLFSFVEWNSVLYLRFTLNCVILT